MNWQPIETAPRDGTPILVARWNDTFGWVRGWAHWESATEFIQGWVSRGFYDPPGELGLAHPEIWQPMPEAPEPRFMMTKRFAFGDWEIKEATFPPVTDAPFFVAWRSGRYGAEAEAVQAARLADAAPELLAACKAARDLFEPDESIGLMLDAAIAKAEGADQ